MESLRERLNELEMRFMHQQHGLEELSEVLLGFDRRLAAVEQELRRLRETLVRMESAPELSPDE